MRDYHQAFPDQSGIGKRKRKRVQDKGRKRKRIPLFFLAIPLLAGLLIFWAYEQFRHSSLFRIRVLQVEGCSRVPSLQVSNSLKLDPECNILLLDLSVLSARARSNPWIQEAAICRRLPHTLVVKVMERRPAGILVADDRYLISEDGVILARLPRNESVDLPFIRLATAGRGYHAGDGVQIAPFEKGSTIWRDLSQTVKGLGAEIREVYQTKDGSLSFNLGGGMPSLRLRTESFEEQCTRLKETLASYGPDWRSLEYIDLRFAGKVILKPLGK